MYATKSNSVSFDPCPAGMHHAVCYRVVDMGTQIGEWKGQEKKQRKVLISWELPHELKEPYTDGEGKQHPARPFTIHKKYTLSFHEKARLLNDLNSWRGRPFTDAELAGPPDGFYMGDLIGVNCQLNVLHNVADNGNTYANIEAIVPILKGMQKLEPVNKTLFLDLEQFDRYAFDELSEKMQEVITKSPEYAAAQNGDATNQDRDPARQAPQGYNSDSASHAAQNVPAEAYAPAGTGY